MQHHTRDDLLDFMLRCLTTVIDKAPPSTTEKTPPQFHQVLKEQTLIGWPQLLHGHWQQLHLQSHTTPPNSKQKPAQWSKAILKTMWQQWHDMWIDRCKDRHGHNTETKAAAEREQLQRKVTQLYGWKPLLSPEKQKLFFKIPLARLLRRTTNKIFQWIQLWEPHIKESFPEQEPDQTTT